MQTFINQFNMILLVLITVCCGYQVIYALVALLRRPHRFQAQTLHHYAVIIAARNEETVIAQLIDSVHRQAYPQELLDVYVIADNCTDRTAETARRAGARVIERFNREQVGKGHALDYGLNQIFDSPEGDQYEGFFFFDADNLLDCQYVAEMNHVFDRGYQIVTGYRNSKNYDTNWIAAGHSLWFLRECRYLSRARMLLGTSCAISGTGFLVHSDILRANGGWKHHLLTEDLEFSIDNAMDGQVIGYCERAMFYDEQPETMRQSWTQRLRWVKGGYQIMAQYTGRMLGVKGIKRKLTSMDLLLSIAPLMMLSVLGLLINGLGLAWGLYFTLSRPLVVVTLEALRSICVGFYITFFLYGSLTVITEWRKINASALVKCLSVITYPVFVLTYLPIAFAAIGREIEWKPIHHTVVKGIEEFSDAT